MRILIATALLSAALTANGQSIPTSTDVTYSCTIVTGWLQGLHPTDFPIDAHYSPVIAASHAPGAAYWGPGETASPGLKTQSEMGNPTTLKEELAEGYLITQGSGWYWYRDEPITSRTVFMSQTIEISLDADHSEVTSTMMVAPSPDWFTGFYGVDFTEGGYWKDEVVLETFAWDAGTDSAETYRHENTPTVPQGVITAFDSVNPGPFTPENPMATWTCGIVVEPTYSVEGEATYSCDFIANFLPSNHPGTEASPHPENFHYSPPVIASHSDTVAYFTAGEPASEGIAVQSTKGNPVPLLGELESLGDLVCSATRGRPQWTITDPDPTRVFAAQTLGNITVSPFCPVVSLTSMLAPSPDWFTGYSSYVVSETDVWPSTFEFYTNLYDSGVDSGETFTSADAPTEPVGTVVEITPEVGGVLSRVVEGVTEVLPGALVKCSLTSYSPYPTIESAAPTEAPTSGATGLVKLATGLVLSSVGIAFAMI